MVFQLLSYKGERLGHLRCELRTKNGKHPIYRQGHPIIIETNQEGRGYLTDVPGGNYCLVIKYRGKKYQILWSLKKIKNRHLTSQQARTSENLRIEQRKKEVRYSFL